MADVIVVGAGPIGLWVAAELHLAGFKVTILEQLAEPDHRSKAAGMAAGTLETFSTRGISEPFIEHSTPINSIHFGASSRLPITPEIGTRHPQSMSNQQNRTERLLSEYCEKLGLQILRSHRVLQLTQNESSVSVTAEWSDGTTLEFNASWLVACDGSRSTMRSQAGIEFHGTSSTITGWLADFHVTDPPAKPLSSIGPEGSCIMQSMGDGECYRAAGVHHATMHLPTSATTTMDDVRSWVKSTFGSDFGMHSPLWISRFGNAARLATNFRKGHVFVAGDAAHQFFPAGGQGINTGLQDGANLAWKLATVCLGRVTGSDAEALLDSYSTERRLAAQAVISNTNAQLSLFTAEKPPEKAVSDIVTEAMTIPEFNLRMMRRVTGFGDPFPIYEDHQDDLIGARVTHVQFEGSYEGLHRLMSVDSFILILFQEETEEILRNRHPLGCPS
ncbi:monooxygenase [Trichoderma velutinum]